MAQQSDISRKIDNILERRKPKAEELRKKREKLLELKRVLMESNQLSVKAKSIEDPELHKKCMELLAKLKIPMQYKMDIDELIKDLDKGIARFERDSINVATVGKARQGKSTFLQAISGLGNDIIPAFDAGDCTGAVSIICNDSFMEPGKVRAELTFRTKEEILEIVKGYIKNICPEYLENNKIEYEYIKYINSSDFQIQEGEAGKTTQLKHLQKIIDDFNGSSDSSSPSIAELFGTSGITLHDPNEIRKYVAQNNGKSESDWDRENYYSYLAVKKAVIYCRLLDDVGKLVLVDTIGLGDTQYGIEEAMLDTVDEQCDAAIVVTLPDAGAHNEDMKLYELLRNRFGHRDIGKWLFYLANERKGYNTKAVDSFVNSIRKNNYSIAKCIKLDCKDSDAVRSDFLLPVLENLTRNMEDIDQAYLREIEQKCNILYQNLKVLVDSFPKAENMSGDTIVKQEVYKMGKKCYRELTSNLAQQVSYWYGQRSKPNATLWNEVKDILNNLESIIPSQEKLQEVLEKSGDMIGKVLWQTPLNYVRNEITDKFIAIDGLMEKETLEFKNAIVGNLYETLKNLSGTKKNDTEHDEETDHVKWLFEVMEPLIKDKPEYGQIYRAFQFLNQFEFNVRAQLILEVRNQLSVINPMTIDYYMEPNYMFPKENVGQAVHFYLTSRLAILEDGLRHSLSKMNRMPNQAFYAASEEFYDRLTFASDFENGTFVDMSEIWGEFFTEYSSLLWAAEVERHKSLDRVMSEYETYCNTLQEKLAGLI